MEIWETDEKSTSSSLSSSSLGMGGTPIKIGGDSVSTR